ncbi:MAG: hypothetical protein IJR90_08255 [Clostridia bacterium]|nr:hypothetical protein [Clostridia bacterium]
MKRIITIAICAIMLVGLFAVPSFAVNKADLLKEAAKSPVYKYVKVAVENAAKTVEITDEQAEKILPIISKAVTAVNVDKGATVIRPKTSERRYSDGQVQVIFNCIKEVCDIMGWTYKLEAVADQKHPGDIIIHVFDGNTKIFSYDGDIVADTSAASDNSVVILTAGGALLLAGFAAVVFSRKRLTVEK